MANKIKGITIEIDGNTTGLTDALKNVNKSINSVNYELSDLQKKLKLDPGNTELLAQKQELLSKKIAETSNKLSTLKTAKQQMDAEIQKGTIDKESEQYRALVREISGAESEMKAMNKELKDTEDALRKGGNGASFFGDMLKANLFSSAIQKGFQTLANSARAVSSAIVDMGKQALNNFAEYEQLVGGVDTLFKDSSEKVQKYAQEAYKTAGVSANEYMETVTSFSASLLQSLSGNTDKAADVADMALKDMSDNANKFGTDMSSIQNAYQGFAKQNYTMLDNLKLGYGGTKTEMQRLLSDAQKLTGVKYDISSLSDVYNAIHAIQQEMGVTGTTAKEAGTTIQGSVNSMKSAWQNLLTGVADGSSNLGELISNFMTTIVGDGTENNRGLIGNILPVVQNIITQIPEMISTLIPQLVPVVIETIKTLAKALLDNMPIIIQALVDLFNGAIDILTDPDMIEKIIEMAVYMIIEFAIGLIEAIPVLIQRLPEIIKAIVVGLGKGIAKVNWGEFGLNMLKGILEGMLNFGNLVKNTIKKLCNGITDAIKSFFGIHSPSKLMENEIGQYLPMGIAEGIADEIPNTIKDVDNAMSELNKGIVASVNPTINPTANTNPLIIQIENFNNERESDIEQIAEELEFYRKRTATAVGGM